MIFSSLFMIAILLGGFLDGNKKYNTGVSEGRGINQNINATTKMGFTLILLCKTFSKSKTK